MTHHVKPFLAIAALLTLTFVVVSLMVGEHGYHLHYLVLIAVLSGFIPSRGMHVLLSIFLLGILLLAGGFINPEEVTTSVMVVYLISVPFVTFLRGSINRDRRPRISHKIHQSDSVGGGVHY